MAPPLRNQPGQPGQRAHSWEFQLHEARGALQLADEGIWNMLTRLQRHRGTDRLLINPDGDATGRDQTVEESIIIHLDYLEECEQLERYFRRQLHRARILRESGVSLGE